MKNFIQDLWAKFRGKLILLIALMVLVGASEGLGVMLFLPLLKLLSGENLTTNFLSQFIFGLLGKKSSLQTLALIIAVVFSCQAFISMIQGKLIAELESAYVDICRRKFLAALLRARWSFFVEHKAGQLMLVFGRETEQLGRAFMLLAHIASTSVLFLIYFLIVVYLSWKFSLLLVLLCLLSFLFITRGFAHKAYATTASYTDNNSLLLSNVNEFLATAKMIKATNSEKRVMSTCDRLLAILKLDYTGVVFSSYALRTILEFFITIGICASLIILHDLGVTFASTLILMAVFLRILPKLHTVQSSYQTFVGYLPSFNSFTNQLKDIHQAAEEEIEYFDDRVSFDKPVRIKFENVSMHYGQNRALNKINFDVQPGTICAVTGPSGAGKSTLVDLIVKIIQVDEGIILINNDSLKDIPTVNWRRSIGYVTQEPLLLHDTIINNITWGMSEYSQEDVLRASRLANAHEFIQSLPQAYETVVGERGAKLSGGQRQRIALARALISRPVLLILDEATSALDSESEQAIIETLCQLRESVTILMISHRSAPLRVADQIIVLKQGSIVEVNTGDSLSTNVFSFS